AALGDFLPSVSTGASATRRIAGRAEGDPDFAYSLGWNANLTLFQGFQRIANRRAAAADVDAAEAGFRDERFQVMLATKQLFYATAASDDLVRVATAQLERAGEQLRAAVENLQAGAATISDSLRATVEVGNARIALLRARAANASAQAALGRQIGVGGPVVAVPDSALPALPHEAFIRDEAQSESPAIVQSEAEARAADALVAAARSRYWPSLGMSYGDDYFGTESPFTGLDDYAHSSSLNFSLSWPIFDGFAREAAQVSAATRRDVADAVARDARLRVSAELTRQLALLGAAYEQIEIARINVLAAAEDFRVQNERYRLGVATSLDLTSSQASLTQAEVALIQARFDYLLARAEIEALVGREL
ncbi:MAG TPA: TolC family protein, partial [Candidatus Krumholzibacteria bacterium]|nr:TolC family protein [Candidatus Krumholzibacteria bacterium]